MSAQVVRRQGVHVEVNAAPGPPPQASVGNANASRNTVADGAVQ